MKKSIAKKWVKALRSGKYTKTRDALRDRDGFCCLGVLCDIYSKNTQESWVGYNFLGSGGILPNIVRDWASIRSNSGYIAGWNVQSLVQENDSDKSFNEIADIIEQNVERL